MAVSYTGMIGLGIKRDQIGTVAGIEETFLQKYDNRLKELSELLTLFIANFGCENELTISNVSLNYRLNQYDEVMDFVEASLTINWTP